MAKNLELVLIDKLKEFKKKNPSFSGRAMAKKLDISSSTFSELMRGKRSISENLAKQILAKLQIDSSAQKEVLNDIKKSKNCNYEQKTISEDQFKILADWFHFAILSYLNIEKVGSDLSIISERLGVNKQTLTEAMDRLVRLNMIEKHDDGFYYHSNKRYFAGGEIPSECIKKHHEQIIRKALDALFNVPMEERYISNITFGIDTKKMPKAIREINKFQEKMNKFFSTGKKSEVYNLNVNLFPLTKSSDH